jgi:Uma2 family endonuclease
MEANRSRPRWTYAEFARLPSEGSTRYEVIDGELAVTPAPTGDHQRVVAKLVRILDVFAHEHALGEVLPSPIDVLFGEGDYFEPDVIFIRSERADLVGDRGVEAPPDLVVEILSLSTAHRDRGIKLERYRHFGVPEYWTWISRRVPWRSGDWPAERRRPTYGPRSRASSGRRSAADLPSTFEWRISYPRTHAGRRDSSHRPANHRQRDPRPRPRPCPRPRSRSSSRS